MATKDAFIAANRFGLGARPSELEAIGKNPRQWLLGQISARRDTPPLLDSLTPVAQIMRTYTYNRQMGRRGQGGQSRGGRQGGSRSGNSGVNFRQ